MIDTVHLHLPVLSEKEIQTVLERREKRDTHVKEETGVATRYGNIRNMGIFVNGRGLLVKGSLTKLYRGNNCEMLAFSEICSAIGFLQECIGIDLSKAKVKKLDIGVNVSLCEPIEHYLEIFGLAKDYRRNRWDNSIYYYTHKTIKGSKRVINIYDKIDEAKTNKERIPETYRDENLLRYELRFARRPAEQLGTDGITVNRLMEKDFWELSVRRLITEYERIQKNNKHLPLVSSVIDVPKDLINAYTNYGIAASGGLTAAVKRIENDKRLDARLRYGCKQILKRSAKKIQSSQSSDLIKELDDKVNGAINGLINS